MKFLKEFNESDIEIVELDRESYEKAWKDDNEELYRLGVSLNKTPSSRFIKSIEKQIDKIESLNGKKFDKKCVKQLGDDSIYIYNYDRFSSSRPNPLNKRKKIVTYGLKIWVRELVDSWYLFDVYIFGKSLYFKCDNIYGISKIADYIRDNNLIVNYTN